MALSAKLQLRQSQSLVITPQLMQAIRLLQMSRLDLERFVAAEIETNPLLYEGEGEAPAGGQPGEGATTPDGNGAASAGEQEHYAVATGGSGAFAPSRHRAPSADGGVAPADLNLSTPETLLKHLEDRIEHAFAKSPHDRMIAFALLAETDEAGYLTVTPEALADRLCVPGPAVEAVLTRCQDLAPTGVFARGLAECLALQLKERNRLDPAMQALLANLDRLAARDRASLCAACRVDREDLDDMIAELRALDPKPGLAFASEPVQALIPDVFVRSAAGGGWIVELNEATLPRLIVDRVYHARLAAGSRLPEDKRFLSDCLQKASWLEKSLDQRARTVLGVASEIVRRQEGFLSKGVYGLRPLNLRSVADALGVHESTVSRAAANKTIATPRGIFEFRYFFAGSIPANTGGEAHSAQAVKHRLRKLILDEPPDAVLSDDALVALLAREGVEIARRTVAKYREAMRIGSSVERRREKQMRIAS